LYYAPHPRFSFFPIRQGWGGKSLSNRAGIGVFRVRAGGYESFSGALDDTAAMQ
jgi:hypothetical protein